MSNNLVVVAIPAADDRVWKVSSEKVPHLTICFLGDAPSNPNVLEIMQFVEHAIDVSEHGPFMLRKDYRDVLGDDKADVIHFERDYSFKWVNQFRSQLLQNESIRKAYEANDQYPEWQPHLTLGYPETPAKELDDGHEYDLDWVTFDRIGVWTGNYEGPSWRLKWPEREEFDTVGWSGVPEVAEKPSIEEALEHFGVKGMHWGVRTTNRQFAKSHKLMSRAEKLDEKAVDKGALQRNFLQGRARSSRLNSIRLDQEVHRKVMYQASSSARKDLKALRKKPEFQNINYRDARGQPQFDVDKFRKLEKEEAGIWTSHLNKVVKDRGYEFDAKTSGNTWELVPKQVKHADDEALETFVVNVIRDDDGFFVDAELADTEKEENSLAQTAGIGEEWLKHFGIKGMRWGVRKERELTTQTHIDTGLLRRQTKVQVKGGHSHEAHPDAVKAAVQKQKLKKSGPAALSTQELRDLANRLQVENQVAVLTSSKGKRFVNQQLEEETKGALRKGAQKGIKTGAPLAAKKARKAAATGAVALVL